MVTAAFTTWTSAITWKTNSELPYMSTTSAWSTGETSAAVASMFFAIVDPHRWEAAWAAVRSKLIDLELLQRAVVARQVEDSEPEVLWPEAYGQDFRFWEEPHNYLA
jgi:hypothetical protein